jgi:hypothetical protein
MNEDLVCLISCNKILDSDGITDIQMSLCLYVWMDYNWRVCTAPLSVGDRNFSAKPLGMVTLMNQRAISKYLLKSQSQQFMYYVCHCSLEYVNTNCIFFDEPTLIFILRAGHWHITDSPCPTTVQRKSLISWRMYIMSHALSRRHQITPRFTGDSELWVFSL